MSRFIPLNFTTYNWDKVSPNLVCTPPYDVYDLEYRKYLAQKSNYNFVHLDVPSSYEGAGELLKKWYKEQVIQKLKAKSFILLKTEYKVDSNLFTRWGILGGLKLTSLGKDYVFAHEKTYPKAKEDRLKLMQATSSQFSPIFGLYADKTLFLNEIVSKLNLKKPWLTLKESSSITHKAWIIPEQYNQDIVSFFDKQKFFIADGHHRYETALNYQKLQAKQGPWDYVFIYLSNLYSEGVNIFPYHRILSWEEKFDLKIIKKAEENFEIKYINDLKEDNYDFFLFTKENIISFRYKKDRKDNFHQISTYLLDEYILKRIFNLSEDKLLTGKYIKYTPFIEEVKEQVIAGKSQLGFIVNKVDLNIFQNMCLKGELMPRKSTYFYPKVPSGLIFYSWI